MSFGYAFLVSCLVCALAAALEGACAGRNVKAFFSTLKFPHYSAPLWVWWIIGGVYYLIFGFVIYRLLRLRWLDAQKGGARACAKAFQAG